MYNCYEPLGLHEFREDAAQEGQETDGPQVAILGKPAYGI